MIQSSASLEDWGEVGELAEIAMENGALVELRAPLQESGR